MASASPEFLEAATGVEWPLPVRPDIDLDRLRDYRLQRLREQLIQADVAVALITNPVSLRYASDFREYAPFQAHIPTYSLLVPAEGPMALCSGYAQPIDTVNHYRPLLGINVFDSGLDLGPRARRLPETLRGYLKELCITDARPKIALDAINPSATQALVDAGFTVIDVEPLVEAAKCIKSADEISCLRHAIDVAQYGMAVMQQAMRPGVTEQELWALLAATNLVYDGDWTEGRMLASGTRTNPWYQEATQRRMRAGELVAFDTDMVGPFGYCADVSRTWLCGDGWPSPGQRALYQRAHDEIAHNIELLRPGMSLKDFSDQALRQPDQFVALRYACVAHGVGMCDEYPKIYYRQDWKRTGYDGVIEPNMTLCIESYVGRVGGSQGVKLEECVVVTETSCERLSSYPFESKFLD